MNDRRGVEIRWDVRVTMRDGVQLSAIIYLPSIWNGPYPAIVALTPYTLDNYHQRAMDYAADGFAFVIADVRGRGNSGGIFIPHDRDGQDGHDLVEWVAGQDFCNSRVAMWGASYLAHCQWMTAANRPPHLRTIAPIAAPFQGVDFPMRNNVFYPFVVRWLAYVAGRASQRALFADEAYWAALFRRWHGSGTAFRSLDALAGFPSPWFQVWLDHPAQDEYWDAKNPSDAEYAALDLPVLTITGMYDDDQPGALEHYCRHLRNRGPAATDQHWLIIGPWDHLRCGKPEASFGGLNFGPASLVDVPALLRQWYCWTLGDGPKPQFLKGRVTYYLAGAEVWRHAPSLAEVSDRFITFYLDSDGKADDVLAGGTLGDSRGVGPADHYVYDPLVLKAPEVAAESAANPSDFTDQSTTFALTGKQLVYHSAPLEAFLEVAGTLRLGAWIELDCPDTDIYATIWEVRTDGSAIRLATDVIRARYRRSLRAAEPVTPQLPELYQFNRFTFAARRLAVGSRLRLTIAPFGRIVESTFIQKNYNAGGVVADETAADGRAVKVTLHHSGERQSFLHVPVATSQKAGPTAEVDMAQPIC